jgi:hypothetical protein
VKVPFDLIRHYTNKYSTMPSFIAEICKALSVGNVRRSSINFAQIAADMEIPENSYVLLDVVVKTAPEVCSMLLCQCVPPLISLLFFRFMPLCKPEGAWVLLET